MTEYRIHPSIGIARVGTSDSFYLTPIKEGGLPIECDKYGNEIIARNDFEYVSIRNKNGKLKEYAFKDKDGKIRKQAAKFRLYKYDFDKNITTEVDPTKDDEIKSIEWTVHLANKKAAWYNFSEYQGDTLFGPQNSYKEQKVPLRSPEIVGPERQKLIIDFGPRTVSGRLQGATNATKFSAEGAKGYHRAYNHGKEQDLYKLLKIIDEDQPPDKVTYGSLIESLGEIKTDRKGNLIVLGGSGNAGGDTAISGFAGAETWHDDVSDGPVTCKITFKNDKEPPRILKAWVIVCSPKFAPKLRNISTLDDALFDVYVRQFKMVTDMFDNNWKRDYGKKEGEVDFDRDISPLIDRAGDYRWVANVPSMVSFHWPSFNERDASKTNIKNRQRFFKYFRDPGNLEKGVPGERELLSKNGVPLMPQNSGSNSVTAEFVDKFATVTNTQYFMLKQWADGKFTAGKNHSKLIKCKVCDAEFKNKKELDKHWKGNRHGNGEYRLDFFGRHPLDRGQLANCVGIPMCPGIEVTWNMKNKIIYDEDAFKNKDYYRIKHRNHNYLKSGLDFSRDETEGGGCEPGDLTKRMALPWHADMFECTIEYVSLPKGNNVEADTGEPTPPSYFAYWWPPQAPVHVIFGDMNKQAEAGIPAGTPVNFLRGINSHMQMIYAWKYAGFIVDTSREPLHPNFVEMERNHDKFQVLSTAIDRYQNVWNPAVEIFNPVWYLKEYKQVPTS